MKIGRLTTALALSVGLFGASAHAGNGSNYLHLLNGVDYFFGKTPPNGNLVGIWRCFPSEILHSPTRVVDPNATPVTVGQYATKLEAMHITINGSPGSTLDFPTTALSSSPGDCRFLTSGGTAVNYFLASVAGFGTVVVGPANGGGFGAVNLLAGVGGLTILNPAAAPNIIVQLAVNLTAVFGSPSTITVPENESLVYWVQDDPNQTGVADWQYWTGSFDERTLASSYSYLFSGSTGTVFAFVPQFEWSIGLGSLDATLTTAIRSFGGGPSLLNAHDPASGFLGAAGFDQGTGTRNISISGTTPPNSTVGDVLGFAHYDNHNVNGGTNKLIFANLFRLVLPSPVTPVGHYAATFINLHPLAGGPALSPAIPQNPRITIALDLVTSALLANPLWTGGTTHGGAAGASNVPWFPAAAGVSGSTGNTGGFQIPIPPLPSIPGLDLGFSAVSLNAAGTAIAKTANNGHSHTNSYNVFFQP